MGDVDQRRGIRLQEPANFGMAKSFVLMGKEAGFDMESPEGMQAWVKAYNATVAPAMAAASGRPGTSNQKEVAWRTYRHQERAAPREKTMREENHRSREGNDILSVAVFTHGACFLDYGHSSEPAGEPSYGTEISLF